LPLLSLGKAKNIFISWIPNLNLKNNGLIFITNNLKGTFSLYNEKGNFLGTFNIGDKISQYNNLSIIEIISETGLQIRADPGIPLIYFGFAILMISSLISYFSFTQFWLLKKQNKLYISATSNRAKLNLRIEFLKLTLPYLLN
jgi:cytochrome c biogenesis protein